MKLWVVVGRDRKDTGLFIVAICDNQRNAEIAKRRSGLYYRDVYILDSPEECNYMGRNDGVQFILNKLYGLNNDEIDLLGLEFPDNISQKFYDKGIFTLSELCNTSDKDIIEALDNSDDFYEVLSVLHNKGLQLHNAENRLSSIGLPTFIIINLFFCKIRSISKLCSYSERGLHSVKYIDSDDIDAIKKCLTEHGLSLCTENG